MEKRDFYDVLGVAKDATADHIRSAYRKLARKYHPDVNKAADSATKFKEATEAYEVLSDKEKRAKYDQFGHVGPGMPPGGGGGPGGGRTYTWSGRPGEGFGGPGGGGPGGVSFEEMFGGGQGFSGMSLDEILESLGGASRRGRRGRGASQPPPQDVEYEVTLDFMQAVQGATVSLRVQGTNGQTETINVKIPPGVDEGSKVRVRGKGAGGGDLYLVTHIREHPYFRREGQDVYVELPIGITEAALGAKVDAPTLDGMTTLTVPPGSSSGRKMRLREKGIVAAGSAGRGDQYVVIKIVVPPSIAPKAADLLKEFDRAQPFDPRAGVPWK